VIVVTSPLSVISKSIAGVVLTFALISSAEAQPGKLYRIGYLTGNPRAANAERIDAFRQGLRELGYIEGKNIVIHWRSADGKLERLPGLATELVRLNVDRTRHWWSIGDSSRQEGHLNRSYRHDTG
jgi:hypothetical protein